MFQTSTDVGKYISDETLPDPIICKFVSFCVSFFVSKVTSAGDGCFSPDGVCSLGGSLLQKKNHQQ